MAKTISSLNVILGGVTSPFANAFGGAQSTITRFQSSIKSAGATLLKFTGIGAGVAAVLGTIGSVKGAISLAADLEQTGIAFETMLGSASAARALMGELTQFASSTPFEFPGIADAAKKLLAFGVANTAIQEKLKTLGDISAGTGKDLGELAGVYGKIKSRGQLTGETLNQLAEAGVPIYRALSEQLGVTQSKIADMVSKGKVGFAQVDQALTGLTATGGQFAGLMEKQSRSLGGLWSTLTDNISMTSAGMAQTLIDAFNVKDLMSGFIGSIGTAGAWLQNAASAWAPIVINVMARIRDAMVGGWSQVTQYVSPAVNALATVFRSIGASLAAQIPTVQTITAVAQIVGTAVATAAAGFAAWKVATLALTAAHIAAIPAMTAWRVASAAVSSAANLVRSGQKLLQIDLMKTTAAKWTIATATTAWKVTSIAATTAIGALRGAVMLAQGTYLLMTGAITAGTLATRAMMAVTNIWKVVTTGMTAAQWLLNVALNANPIGLVVVAIGAAAAAVGYLVSRYASLNDVISFGKKVMDGAVYTITNWQLSLQVAGAYAALFATRTASQLKWVFTTVVPSVLKWFGENWRDIFQTVWNFTKSVFSNIAINIKDFASALWNALKGKDFTFTFTPLTDGFVNTIKEWPGIAEREIGPLEAALADKAADLSKKFSDGFEKYQKGFGVEVAVDDSPSALSRVKGWMQDLASRIPPIKPPEVKPPEIKLPDTGLSDLGNALDETKAKADGVVQALAMIRAGSAEAMQLSAQASFSASIWDMGTGGSSLASPASTDLTTLRRESASASRANDAGGLVPVLLERLIAAVKENGIVLNEAA